MSAYEGVAAVSVIVGVDNTGTPAVERYHFAKWSGGAGFVDQEVIAATGVADIPAGILAGRPDTKLNPGVAYKAPAVPMAVANGGIQLIELGEAVSDLDMPLRPGAGGKAFLADATGDRKVAMPLERGEVGQIVRCQLLGGASELVP